MYNNFVVIINQLLFLQKKGASSAWKLLFFLELCSLIPDSVDCLSNITSPFYHVSSADNNTISMILYNYTILHNSRLPYNYNHSILIEFVSSRVDNME